MFQEIHEDDSLHPLALGSDQSEKFQSSVTSPAAPTPPCAFKQNYNDSCLPSYLSFFLNCGPDVCCDLLPKPSAHRRLDLPGFRVDDVVAYVTSTFHLFNL